MSLDKNAFCAPSLENMRFSSVDIFFPPERGYTVIGCSLEISMDELQVDQQGSSKANKSWYEH